jgi:hypothetical protein
MGSAVLSAIAAKNASATAQIKRAKLQGQHQKDNGTIGNKKPEAEFRLGFFGDSAVIS